MRTLKFGANLAKREVMGIFSKAIRSFYSVILDGDECKFFFREIDAKRRVKNELLEYEQDVQNEYLDGKLATFMTKTENKSGHLSILDTNLDHNFITNLDEFDGYTDEYEFENVASNFVIYYKKADANKIDECFKITFNAHITPLKTLYFLYKNQECAKSSNLFVLKFNTQIAVILADEKNVKLAKNLQIKNDNDVCDEDELLHSVIREIIDEYYADDEADFIDSIYIYGDDVSSQSGYLIFTKLFINTKIVPINLIDFLNKIAIKENR